jgi:hypothetical protein
MYSANTTGPGNIAWANRLGDSANLQIFGAKIYPLEPLQSFVFMALGRVVVVALFTLSNYPEFALQL